MSRQSTAVLIGLGILSLAGQTAAAAGAAAQVEFFERKIRPLFATHCYGCHSRDAKKVKGELYLDSRAGVRKGGASGPIIALDAPEKSLLLRAVRYDDPELRMPPKGKLNAAEIADLAAWVKMGAPDPRGDKDAPTKVGPIDFKAAKKFWSLQPVRLPDVPATKDKEWPVTAVDRFILAKLEEHGLRPVGLTDKHTLLRRVTYDLTGLPPTPEEIAAFSKDSTPDAYARVVERLLASKAYGERWGRHWLDVVRYADTAGDNSDYPIPQMVKYRDWVIDAVAKDMPYDQFVREQLAGDLMSSKSEEEHRQRIIATGYLANSRRHGSYEDARYPWHLTIEDTIDNFGKAFLGLSIHCARCHDHKFDPLLAEDYYGLYGFFSSTRYPWPGIELDRAPRDLVPLASPAEVDKVMKSRAAELNRLDAKHKQLLADKAPADKIAAAKKERDLFAKTPLPFATAFAVIDGRNEPKKRIGQVGDVRLHIKGDPDRLGKTVPRRFPLVLGGQALSPETKGSGRLELAQWLTDPKNPLIGRVMVNRIWQHHFGTGIVATPNDFGKLGRPPTHPELLDYLTHLFVHGEPDAKGDETKAWSVKRMHRLIVLSRVYQLAATDDDANSKLDPENHLHWRFARHRLDAESIRDALLVIGGNLDRAPGGPHPFPDQKTWDFTQHKPFKAVYDTNRRSVYLMTQRIQRHPFLALFDGPDTNASTATRPTSTTSLQALFLLNNPFVHDQARKFAARMFAEGSDDAARIERAFLVAFGRPATADEKEQALSYLGQVRAKLTDVPAADRPLRAWESLARVLIMSNEFVYVN